MAKTASISDMFALAADIEPLPHGGDLAAARRLFPGVPQPFIDLSTGINPFPYPLPRLPAELFARLPNFAAHEALTEIAARAYGVPSAAHVVAAPGTQILLPLAAALVPPGRAAVIAPTYGEFARAAVLAGHSVTSIDDLAGAEGARLVVVANPNNPDGRVFAPKDLLAVGVKLRGAGGLLVVDEAFMDVGPPDATLAGALDGRNIVVLRSFGKFFGLAGVRLGFALAAPAIAARLAALLGPWAVSGPALAIGAKALDDFAWIEKTKDRLTKSARRLDELLMRSRLEIVGGTPLFRLVRTPAASALFRHLGHAGIVVRAFAEHSDWLRFGLPPNKKAWRLLQSALSDFGRGG
ncbi:MAG: threonine-phosphate decarboxylase CobD [Xanthobacteraceae bacterium]